MTEHGRLAAVMFLDMVGYSSLMSRSQPSALVCVRDLEALVRELIPAAGGRVVKFLGDGTMAEFPTPGAAFECAQAIHRRIRSRNAGLPKDVMFFVRIGLHLGQLVEKDGDLFGDAVNIAARVMPLADPEGIAMSAAFHAEIRNQFSPAGGFLPSRKLKNLPGRAAVFVVPPEGAFMAAWTLRRRYAPRALAFAGLAVVLAAAGAWFLRPAENGPVRVGLLYIEAENDSLKPVIRSIEDELATRIGNSAGFLWVARAGIIELFDQEGISDLSQIEKLERKACRVARKGGLHYSLVARLKPGSGRRWRLDSRIVCTKSLAVVGSFSSLGDTAQDLAADQHRQLVSWAAGYDLLPETARQAKILQ